MWLIFSNQAQAVSRHLLDGRGNAWARQTVGVYCNESLIVSDMPGKRGAVDTAAVEIAVQEEEPFCGVSLSALQLSVDCVDLFREQESGELAVPLYARQQRPFRESDGRKLLRCAEPCPSPGRSRLPLEKIIAHANRLDVQAILPDLGQQ